MYTGLAGSAIGAAAGVLASAYLGDKEFRIALPFFGGAVGTVIGEGVEAYARAKRNVKFRESLGTRKGDNIKDIKRLVKTFRELNIPIYLQSAGTGIDNAMYLPKGRQPVSNIIPEDAKFKPLFGKSRLLGKYDIPESTPSVVIGKGFNNIPILAHELGHAEDFRKDKLKSLKLSAGSLLTGGLLALGSIAYYTGMDITDRLKDHEAMALGALGGLAVGASGGLMNYSTRKLEQNASEEAAKRLREFYAKKEKKYKEATDLLSKAYSTYEPIQINETVFA